MWTGIYPRPRETFIKMFSFAYEGANAINQSGPILSQIYSAYTCKIYLQYWKIPMKLQASSVRRKSNTHNQHPVSLKQHIKSYKQRKEDTYPYMLANPELKDCGYWCCHHVPPKTTIWNEMKTYLLKEKAKLELQSPLYYLT